MLVNSRRCGPEAAATIEPERTEIREAVAEPQGVPDADLFQW